MKLGWDYPLHLGVTEAGEGEDGRVKSAVGIGSLLLDGIGDTIRVSLTEDPWAEIDPCQRLVRLAKEQEGKGTARFEETCRDIKIISKRKVQIGDSSFLHPSGSVLLKVKGEDLKASDFYKNIGCKTQLGRPFKDLGTPDLIWVEDLGCDEKTAVVLDQLHRAQIGVVSREPGENRVLIRKIDTLDKHEDISHCIIEIEEINDHILDKMVKLRPLFFLFSSKKSLIHEGRRLMQHLRAHQNEVAVLLAPSYQGDWQDVVIKAPAECGALLTDGLFDGVCLQVSAPYEDVRLLSFNLLQACRMRTTKTEFISCPGCGRTLFDLQSVTKRIREKTAHLPGVKIAIMGCIVNGPGEMADADFGYVGSKAGKIDLYVGKECVERNIDFSEADERLVELIKSHGKWVDPVLV
jgi:(E)-4-hydroxy-3-methylbut-2-enyl-diphosphate synthase